MTPRQTNENTAPEVEPSFWAMLTMMIEVENAEIRDDVPVGRVTPFPSPFIEA